jgi:hypothetical protein
MKEVPDLDALDGVEKPLVTCLYSDRQAAGEGAAGSRGAGGRRGYGTTHRFLSYLIMKRFGVFPVGFLDARIEAAIYRIADAQRTASASDILYERTVLLQWLGRDHLVEPAWILRILARTEEKRGMALDPSFRQRREEQHPSCLDCPH